MFRISKTLQNITTEKGHAICGDYEVTRKHNPWRGVSTAGDQIVDMEEIAAVPGLWAKENELSSSF